MTEASAGPLAGIEILELGAYLTAPFATMMLADLGATVRKVESPKGDPFRRFQGGAPMSAQFASVNRNKRSIVADLKTPAGVERVLAEVEQVDVVVSNWRPGTGDRLGLSDAELVARNETLIRCYITGFGPDGPDAGRPAFDGIAQAVSGLTWTWDDGPTPVLAANYLADSVTSSMTAQAVMAALVGRTRTGRGERVDVAMVDAFAYLNHPAAMAHRFFLDDPHPAAAARTNAIRPIAASDGWLVLAPVTRKQMDGACAAVGHPEWTEELIARHGMANLSLAMMDRLETVTRTDTVEHWMVELESQDVPVARCLSIDEHLDSDYARTAELYSEQEWPSVGRVRQIRYPARFTSWPTLGYRSPAP